MATETTRLSVEIPKKAHKKLKILAEINELTLKDLILFALDPILYPEKKPNKTTLKAIENTEKGIGLTSYESVEQMWDELGLNE